MTQHEDGLPSDCLAVPPVEGGCEALRAEGSSRDYAGLCCHIPDIPVNVTHAALQ